MKLVICYGSTTIELLARIELDRQPIKQENAALD
jgi:hypothetical protein